ncbi:hypothetical protein [Streptomyces laurentii]|uniref:hypothetical protein n=1 Tax=Streptomyces laurentii TaxID=39478 RepID=UPI0033E92D81
MTESTLQEQTATLLVGAYRSRCSHCQKGALLSDTHHHRVAPGYPRAQRQEAGCGARFTATASTEISLTHADLTDLRPDLPVLSQTRD